MKGRWLNKKDFTDAVHKMGLVIGQSDHKKQRYRLRVRGRRDNRTTLTTFRYYSTEMAIVRTSGRNSIPLEVVLSKWESLVPVTSPDQPEPESKRRPNVVWTHAAVEKVLDMIDLTKTNSRYWCILAARFRSPYVCSVCCRYTLRQIAEQLNRKETEHLYKDPADEGMPPRQTYNHPNQPQRNCVGREFTSDNIQAFLKRVFPSQDDTQAAVEMLG